MLALSYFQEVAAVSHAAGCCGKHHKDFSEMGQLVSSIG
jgi:hypothetical protein